MTKQPTEKEIFSTEIKRKKSEWRQFMTFMKRNPEAILGVADSEPKVEKYHTLEPNKILNIESESNIGGIVRQPRITGFVRS